MVKSETEAYYWTTPEELRCPHATSKYKPLMCAECDADHAFRLYSHVNMMYRRGEAIWWDSTYDWYEKLCRKLWPEDNRFWKVG